MYSYKIYTFINFSLTFLNIPPFVYTPHATHKPPLPPRLLYLRTPPSLTPITPLPLANPRLLPLASANPH